MKHPLLAAVLLTFGLLLNGCGGQAPSPETEASNSTDAHDDHDHDHDHDHGHDHEQPETFDAAVAELAELRDKIESALAEDDLKKADGPVHEVGHVLEGLGSLAEKAGLSEEQQATVKDAQKKLFSAFGGLDETIHGKESGKTWDQVSSDINEAIASLQALAAPGESEGTEQ
ncbi:hypothetical protein [Maioricimonas sp. JC845]|uniref:hypothetical protein n=1 Tax=Maioricimonas sp. JC845 TaxID=3232138 RepID=UPI003459CD3D